MGKKKKNLLILLLITVGLIFLLNSQIKTFGVLTGYDYHTESSIISEDAESTTYSYSYIVEHDIPPIECQDSHYTTEIEFEGDVHPESYSNLPCFTESLQQNVDFLAFDIVLSPLFAQRSAPCNPPTEPVYEVRYNNTGTTCKVVAGTESGGCRRAEVQCHFTGNLRAYDSSGESVPAVFGAINFLSAKVTILKEGILPGETCSDGIKNQDETGIDCGGICSACSIILPETDFTLFYIIGGLVLVVIIIYFRVWRK